MASTFPDPAGLLAGKLTTGLTKVGTALRHHAWAESGRWGLNPTQGQILALLRAAGDAGLRVSELADQLAVTPATASDSILALARKGLVSKRRHPRDARVVLVALTGAGRAQAEAAAGWPDLLLEAVVALSPQEQATLLRALVKLMRSLQARGRIPISQMCVSCRFFRPYAHPDAAAPHHCAFVDAPFGDSQLRLECPDHQPASAAATERASAAFAAGPSHPQEAP